MPAKFPHFLVFIKVLKIGMFGLSKQHEQIHRLTIFLDFRDEIWFTFLNAKGSFDTSRCLSSQTIWQNLISAKFNGDFYVNTALHVLPDFLKMKLFWKL